MNSVATMIARFIPEKLHNYYCTDNTSLLTEQDMYRLASNVTMIGMTELASPIFGNTRHILQFKDAPGIFSEPLDKTYVDFFTLFLLLENSD